MKFLVIKFGYWKRQNLTIVPRLLWVDTLILDFTVPRTVIFLTMFIVQATLSMVLCYSSQNWLRLSIVFIFLANLSWMWKIFFLNTLCSISISPVQRRYWRYWKITIASGSIDNFLRASPYGRVFSHLRECR